MKLSFVKTIQGHQLEFVRLLYPLRYDVYLRQADANPLKMTLLKDENGDWTPDQVEELPGWVNEISLSIITSIEENEVDAVPE